MYSVYRPPAVMRSLGATKGRRGIEAASATNPARSACDICNDSSADAPSARCGLPRRGCSLADSDVVVGLDTDTVSTLDTSEQSWRTNGTHALIQARK